MASHLHILTRNDQETIQLSQQSPAFVATVTSRANNSRGVLNKIREKNRRFKKYKTRDGSKHNKASDSNSIEIDVGDPLAEHSLYEAYAVFSSAFNN